MMYSSIVIYLGGNTIAYVNFVHNLTL